MSVHAVSSHLPDYQTFIDSIAPLALPLSGSELHGMMCGFLCAGATRKGEDYLRALMLNKQDESARFAILALFDLYAVSQQQIINLDFEFQLMLPCDTESLPQRVQAFIEWCEGFTQGLAMGEINQHAIDDEETQEAIQHMHDFSHIDQDDLPVGEEDERALMEVNEYARMAVLRIYSDLKQSHAKKEKPNKAH